MANLIGRLQHSDHAVPIQSIFSATCCHIIAAYFFDPNGVFVLISLSDAFGLAAVRPGGCVRSYWALTGDVTLSVERIRNLTSQYTNFYRRDGSY